MTIAGRRAQYRYWHEGLNTVAGKRGLNTIAGKRGAQYHCWQEGGSIPLLA
jgi:hypothetical protein